MFMSFGVAQSFQITYTNDRDMGYYFKGNRFYSTKTNLCYYCEFIKIDDFYVVNIKLMFQLPKNNFKYTQIY